MQAGFDPFTLSGELAPLGSHLRKVAELSTRHFPKKLSEEDPMCNLTKTIGRMLLGTLLYGASLSPCYAEDAAVAAPKEIPRVPQNLLPATIASPLLSVEGKKPEKGLPENGWGLLLLETVVAGVSNLVQTHYANPCWKTVPGGSYRHCLDERAPVNR